LGGLPRPTIAALRVAARDGVSNVDVVGAASELHESAGRREYEVMPFIFRRGTEADARAAADLWLRARQAAVGVIPRAVHCDDDVRAWFASHVVRNTELWVAEDRAGTLVGILVLEGRWLDQLYVEPTMTGQGIGAGLVKLAQHERPEGLRLWTFASNAGAQRFYERHGFVEAHRTDGRDNEEGAPDVLYVWVTRASGPDHTAAAPHE
jgi:GNAT superfamily N-acetyltransferase